MSCLSSLNNSPWMTRMRARWRIIRNHGDELNRRVTVENVLLAVAAGKRPMLTQEECRQLAYKLGMPGPDAK
jgi:hypothetical protein